MATRTTTFRTLTAIALLGLIQSSQAGQIKSFGQIPLYFEANRGQADGHIDFLARGLNYHLSLEQGEATFALPLVGEDSEFSAATVRMHLIDAHPNPTSRGLEKRPGVVNYLLGDNPSGWIRHVPTYGKVRFEGIYDGVDLVYYGQEEKLEYDFLVAPHADPSRIALRLDTGRDLTLTKTGRLALPVEGQTLFLEKPVAYQLIDGKRVEVNCAFRLNQDILRFDLGTYNSAHLLVIDPIVTYMTFIGGSLQENYGTVCADDAGNAYVSGYTYSTDFGGTPGTIGPAIDHNVFVAKISADGSTLIYNTVFGGSDGDSTSCTDVDALGRLAVSGQTESPDFPTKLAADPTYNGNDSDAFVAKLNAAGDDFVFSTFLGTPNVDFSRGVCVDTQGDVYATLSDAQRVFTAKYDGDTGAQVYIVPFNSPGSDADFHIDTDDFGYAYVLGFNISPIFPSVGTPFVATTYPVSPFLLIYDDAGTLIFAQKFGSPGLDVAWAVTVDSFRNIHIAGMTQLASSFLPALETNLTGGALPGAPGNRDGFLIKLEPLAAGVIYAKVLGGSGEDNVYDVDVDLLGNTYVLGSTASPDLITVDPISSYQGNMDAFLYKILPAGDGVEYVTYFGGTSFDSGLRGDLDLDDNYYGAGISSSTDFDRMGDFNPLFGFIAGGQDAYLFKLSSLPPTCLEQIGDLRDAVDLLKAEGTLNNGQANSLQQPLKQAEKFFKKNNDNGAVNMMKVFLNKLRAYLRGGILAPAEVADLLVEAETIQTRIENNECE